MSKVSTMRKLGVAARVARDQAGRSRAVRAGKAAVFTTVRSFLRTAHVLWLEVTGTVFLAMAFVGSVGLIRECAKYQTGHTTAGRVAIAVGFTITFAWFGLTSFWRARKNGSKQQS